MNPKLIAIVALLVLNSPGVGRGEDPKAPPGLIGNFVGIWLLDRDASDPMGPLLELMKAPWIARRMAAVVTPTLTISRLGERGLRVVSESRIRTTDREIPADGVERERQDARGRKVVGKATWNDAGQLVVIQQNHIESNRVIEVSSTWARVGDTLEFTIRAQGEDGPLSIRRVFRRKP